MSKLRDFIYQGPGLCGLSGVNAIRWGESFVNLFDKEIADKGSVFALQDGESIEHRLDVLNGLYMARGANRAKVSFFIGCLMLAAMACAEAKGDTEHAEPKDRLKGILEAQEADNAELASLMSVQEASTLSQWA